MIRLKRLALVFLAVMLFGLGCTPYEGGGVVGGTLIGYIENDNTNQWQIISINATTGSTDTIATLGPGDPEGVLQCGFAVDSANDKAYLCGLQGTRNKIYTIDLSKSNTFNSGVSLTGRAGVVGVCFDVYNK